MANYVFIYHGGKQPDTPEEGTKMMEERQKWLDGLADTVVDAGQPMGMSKTVMSDGSVIDNGGSNPASGFSIFEADDMDGALKMAQSCPFLDMEGTIEVAETFEM